MSGSTEVISRGAYLSKTDGKDYNHATDSEYAQYRKLADVAYGKRAELSRKSQAAYKSGDGEKAKQYSEQAKQQAAEAEKYNGMAAEYVFVENNRDSDENDIDLHGLYVREAEYILKQRIINGVLRNQASLDCIVGKGLHSKNGIAKLKPAVEDLCKESNLRCQIDPKNTGVLMIFLNGARIPDSWRGINPNGVGAMVENMNVPDRRKPGKQQQPHYQQQPSYQQQPYQQQPYQQQPYQQQNYQQQPYQQQPYQQQPQQQGQQGPGIIKIFTTIIKVISTCYRMF
ncbi:DEKNAAC101521 [Brettanomyces naardenensis]|uniref:DEKNAAC101522 n=1 Tax=Brettanomyces naardenensis TaxID=13370 RepID=A0A448YID9_BRENA|nr:DEKNAAC101521 [Brettanomyces naardenensis]